MKKNHRPLDFLRETLRYIFQPVLTFKILMKWCSDRRDLPLMRAQYKQYDAIHRLTWKKIGHFPNLRDCQDFNDKIQWLKLFDQRKSIVECSDKVLMRTYVEQRLGPGHTPALHQVCNSFEQIDFSSLPESFVVKTNHDSGSVFLCRKSEINKPLIRRAIQDSMKRPYGYFKGEWAYSYIRPKILVEESLATDENTAPPDYKFHCVNGKVKWLQYIFDRGLETKEVITDSEGAVTAIHFDTNMTHSSAFEKPRNWCEMIRLVEIVADGWKYIRVDAYNVAGRIYIGELTFFPLSGCYKGPGQKELGILLDFERSTFETSID